MPARRYHVFEAVNERLREKYIGATSEQIFMAIEALEARPPAVIGHWDRNDFRAVRSLEFNLDERAAKALIRRFARSAPRGWRYFAQAPRRFQPGRRPVR